VISHGQVGPCLEQKQLAESIQQCGKQVMILCGLQSITTNGLIARMVVLGRRILLPISRPNLILTKILMAIASLGRRLVQVNLPARLSYSRIRLGRAMCRETIVTSYLLQGQMV